jgi:hypothetical protein
MSLTFGFSYSTKIFSSFCPFLLGLDSFLISNEEFTAVKRKKRERTCGEDCKELKKWGH